MPKRKIRFWMILTLLIPLSFGLAVYFDDCEDGVCVPESIVRQITGEGDGPRIYNAKKVVVRINDHGDEDPLDHLDHLDDMHGETTDRDFQKFEGTSVELPDLTGVKKIVILSRNTDWTINHGSKAALTFRDEGRTYIRKRDDTLTIQNKNRAADEGTFTIPEDFEGSLHFASMAGNVRVESAQLKLKEMDLSTLSGDIEIEAFPRERLSVNVTSGNVRAASKFKEGPKEIQIQTVSGDMDLKFLDSFSKLSANTVSGEMHLDVPNTMPFNLNLVSISGDFSGLPDGGANTEQPGHKSYSGSYGKEPKSNIHFHSVGGDFRLSQSEVRTPNL